MGYIIMATSGSTDFNLTAAQIIEVAMLVAARRQSGASVETDDQTEMLRILNLLVKNWQNYAPHMWKRRIAFVPLESGKSEYSVGDAAGDWHISEDYVFSRVNAAIAASGTALTVLSTTGMSNADNILIKKSDGTFDVDTIVSVDSSTTLTLNTGVTEAIAVGQMVFTYTSKIPRPVEVYGMRRRTYSGSDASPSDNDVPIHHIAYKDYWDQPSKDAEGVVTQSMYDRQLVSGKLFVWPTPDDTDIIQVMTFVSPTEDLDTVATDNPDCPQEWLMPLAYNLAYYAATVLRMDPQTYGVVKEQAIELKLQALEKDSDNAGITIDPSDGTY
jgi:hypothetical protein